jgi:hypothetical protein
LVLYSTLSLSIVYYTIPGERHEARGTRREARDECRVLFLWCVSHTATQIISQHGLQTLLTCVGNTTAAYAAWRIARSNGWTPPFMTSLDDDSPDRIPASSSLPIVSKASQAMEKSTESTTVQDMQAVFAAPSMTESASSSSSSLVGFEDLGPALAKDDDYTFVIKLFAGCALASYVIKYGELFFSFPFEANVFVALLFILIPSALNSLKWYKRSEDATFEGWF